MTLESCPWCGMPNISIAHALGECGRTAEQYNQLREHGVQVPVARGILAVQCLLSFPLEDDGFMEVMSYVGKILQNAIMEQAHMVEEPEGFDDIVDATVSEAIAEAQRQSTA